MKTVFVSGSRSISRLNAEVQEKLDDLIESNSGVLIGDANGVDKAVQRYFKEKGYRNVEVFCAGGHCRNNLGRWSVRAIESKSRDRDFSFYASKDRAMTQEASVGFMIWDGRSVGTLLNTLRLIKGGKEVLIYSSPEKAFIELRDVGNWDHFVEGCDPDVRLKLIEKAALERLEVVQSTQRAFAF